MLAKTANSLRYGSINRRNVPEATYLARGTSVKSDLILVAIREFSMGFDFEGVFLKGHGAEKADWRAADLTLRVA